jgi:hypothetical protein
MRFTILLIIALGAGALLRAAAQSPAPATASPPPPAATSVPPALPTLPPAVATAPPVPAAPPAAPTTPPAVAPPSVAPPAIEYSIVDRSHFDLSRPEIRSYIDQLCAQGFERERVTALLAAAEPQQKIIDAMSRPAEKTLQWW